MFKWPTVKQSNQTPNSLTHCVKHQMCFFYKEELSEKNKKEQEITRGVVVVIRITIIFAHAKVYHLFTLFSDSRKL